ncbi:SHOCT-like domain-containing protein [Sedimentibacter sp.]|uniref:SHOCT-like domain-containing protein n=1 Tax=Sedimentibacter sp. TaxID=1960295 RepID=UPI0028A9A0AB|nr:hypothetical protein [Sedimentibacter sp.]
MDEQKRILEMIEKGQITAAEGMELLSALNSSGEPEQEKNDLIPYDSVNVKVNIPIRLLTVLGGIAGKMTNMVPKDAREELESQGIDITSIDFAKIIEELMSGTIDDPSIVDIEAWDEEHNTTVKVKIYAE